MLAFVFHYPPPKLFFTIYKDAYFILFISPFRRNFSFIFSSPKITFYTSLLPHNFHVIWIHIQLQTTTKDASWQVLLASFIQDLVYQSMSILPTA